MKSLTFGTVPPDLSINESDYPHCYEMRLNSTDLETVASIVNQGIDSHLEAVRTRQNADKVDILDSASMRCFLRRCVESGDENAESLASGIMSTLGYEWI